MLTSAAESSIQRCRLAALEELLPIYQTTGSRGSACGGADHARGWGPLAQGPAELTDVSSLRAVCVLGCILGRACSPASERDAPGSWLGRSTGPGGPLSVLQVVLDHAGSTVTGSKHVHQGKCLERSFRSKGSRLRSHDKTADDFFAAMLLNLFEILPYVATMQCHAAWTLLWLTQMYSQHIQGADMRS